MQEKRPVSLADQERIADELEKSLHEKDILAAKEVMMIGTTLDVLPVTEYEGEKIGDGKVGFISQTLRRYLHEDMK